MAEPDPVIRRYVKATDDKLVLFMIGKAHMEPLAIANRKASFHPLSIFTWILLSSIFMQIMGLRPKTQHGFLGYLVPLPAFAVSVLPVVFLIDWLHRPKFEAETKKSISSEDVVTLESYYKKSPASGFWILEFGKKFIGFIAIDVPKNKVPQKRSFDVPPVHAMIRHFYVQEAYRAVSIQSDLLTFAVDHAFKNEQSLQSITAESSQLTAYVSSSLLKAGFHRRDIIRKIGILNWRVMSYELSREDWESKRS